MCLLSRCSSNSAKIAVTSGIFAATVLLGTLIFVLDDNGGDNSNAAAFIALLGANAGTIPMWASGRKKRCCITDPSVDDADAEEVRDMFDETSRDHFA